MPVAGVLREGSVDVPEAHSGVASTRGEVAAVAAEGYEKDSVSVPGHGVGAASYRADTEDSERLVGNLDHGLRRAVLVRRAPKEMTLICEVERS